SVALALVLQVLPQTFIGPAAGVVNDRIRRKHVMITADLARMAIVLAMLFVRSRSTVWLVYPLLLLETMMAAFFEPARSSVIPKYHDARRSGPGQHAVIHDLVHEPGTRSHLGRSGWSVAWAKRGIRDECWLVLDFGALDSRNAFPGAACRIIPTIAIVRSGGFVSHC